MNDILVEVKKSKSQMIYILFKNNIYFKYIKGDNDKHYIKIAKKDYAKLKSKIKKTKIKKYYGKKGIRVFLFKNYIFLLSCLWGVLLLILLSRTIFSVSIISSNEDLIHSLASDLENHNIKKYGRVKSYEEINKIKKELLANHQKELEWLEIKRNGTGYEILLTERIVIEKNNKSTDPRHIVALKDALIKHIEASKGDVVKEVNDYVKKGEIIISGNLYKNEQLISNLHAEGKIYGEVWYIVKTTVPFTYIEYVKTDETINHYYIEIFGKKMTLSGKYETEYAMSETETIIDKPYLFFKLKKEKKEIYEYKEFKITKEQAYEEAIKRSDKGIKNKLKSGERIVNKKVLNINTQSSKIEIETFYNVYENITDILLISESE